MKRQLLLLCSTLILFSGCCETIIRTEYIDRPCAKFPVEEFEPAGDYNLTIKSVGDTVVIEKKDFIDFTAEYKKIKKNYNIIINNLKEFQKGN